MTRLNLEKRAIKTLEDDGYICERAYNKAVYIPGKGYIGRRFDFFSVIDIIAIKGSIIRWVQITSEGASKTSRHHSKTRSNSVYEHKVKIQKHWQFDIPVELWTYTKKSGRWWLSIMVYSGGEWAKYDNPELTGYNSISASQKVHELVNINGVNNNE